MSASVPFSAVASLYRCLLRESNKLPYGYLRVFFRFKLRDDIASTADSIAHNRESVNAKLKRLNRDLRKLKAANEGNTKALCRILDIAYGRSGKLKWELLEPFRHSSSVETPPPIIPGVERSRPPARTRELSSLLTSGLARTTRKGLKPPYLETPRTLPAARLDPNSEESRLLGPLSKRREVNARWRLFKTETSRLYPPLETSVVNVGPENPDRTLTIQGLGLIGGGFQNFRLTESLETMAGNPNRTPVTLGKCNTTDDGKVPSSSLATTTVPPLPSKILRRSHQNLLGKLPILKYRFRSSPSQDKSRKSSSCEVTLSRRAVSPSLRHTSVTVPLIDEENMEWIRRAQGKEGVNRKR